MNRYAASHEPGDETRHGASRDTLTATREHAEKISETVAERAGEARAHVEDGIERLEGHIRRNPLTAAGVAAGVGFVLAFLLRR